jgi:hypothetical protein
MRFAALQLYFDVKFSGFVGKRRLSHFYGNAWRFAARFAASEAKQRPSTLYKISQTSP